MNRQDVVIVGGGLGGLLLAAELKRRGADPVVVEAEPSPGGVARSRHQHGYRLEPAAGTLLLPHPALTPILEAASVSAAPVAPEATRRWVYTRKRLLEVRPRPGLVMSPLVGWGSKLRAGWEPWVRPGGLEDESLEAFLGRRFGTGVGSLAAHLMAAGVHAADPRRLSKYAFETLPSLEAGHGSVVKGGIRRLKQGGSRARMHVPTGGMSSLADALAYYLGDAYRPSFAVAALHKTAGHWVIEGPEKVSASQVVLAVGPPVAARLIGGDLAGLLRGSEQAPVAVVWLGGPQESFEIPTGFGYLTGPDAGFVGLGCLFESTTDPSRAPDGHSLVKIIAGGGTNPEAVDWDDEKLVGRVGEEVAEVLGKEITADFTAVVRHRPGIPQQLVGHREWLARLQDALGGQPGLRLAGWAYRGVGLNHLASDARRTAAELLG